jgi:DNA-binding NtrC family response regulator
MSVVEVDGDEAVTIPWSDERHVVSLRGGLIEVVGGGPRVRVGKEPLVIGRAAQRCGLVLRDPTVSKVHLELQATTRGVRAVDLNSFNGTSIEGTSVVEAYLTIPCELQVGAKRLRFVPEPAHEVVVQGPRRFGSLLGTTPEMTELFAKLQLYAPHSMPIVIQGETGTGKERVAQAIHEASPRRDKPFVPINCAAMPDALLEDELFGHVRGAFTGADRARDGLFVEADGGTLLFDEVGEMSLAMQAKLLRVLENREVRPIGATRSRKVDVRFLFATHVDLRRAMNEGRFREDLYFRMAQITVQIPPLRERLADMRALVDDIMENLGRTDLIVDDTGMSVLLAQSWRGNVRQLRSVIQAASIQSNGPRLMLERVLIGNSPDDERKQVSAPYNVAKTEFDRNYYTSLHKTCDGNISKIAKAAGKPRVTVRNVLRALGLRD